MTRIARIQRGFLPTRLNHLLTTRFGSIVWVEIHTAVPTGPSLNSCSIQGVTICPNSSMLRDASWVVCIFRNFGVV